MARIEIQDQFGAWHRYATVNNSPISIKMALERALKTQLASKSKKVRAIDDKSGALLDILTG